MKLWSDISISLLFFLLSICFSDEKRPHISRDLNNVSKYAQMPKSQSHVWSIMNYSSHAQVNKKVYFHNL